MAPVFESLAPYLINGEGPLAEFLINCMCNEDDCSPNVYRLSGQGLNDRMHRAELFGIPVVLDSADNLHEILAA